MNASGFVKRVTGYFNGKYSEMHLSQMSEILERLDDAALDAIYDRLMEDCSPRFAVGIKEIVDACNALGIGYHKTRYVPATQIWCDACGESFTYAQCVSDDDKIDKAIFDLCPTCGFQPNWTLTMQAYKRYGHLSESYAAWYDKQKKGNSEKYSKQQPYFSRAKAEQERREHNKVKVPESRAKGG